MATDHLHHNLLIACLHLAWRACVQQTQTVRDHFESLGFPLVPAVSPVAPPARPLASYIGYYLDVGGQHSEYYWGARFYVPMTFAYQPTVDVAAPAA